MQAPNIPNMASGSPVRATQLAALPRGLPRCELVRGTLRPMSPAGWRHSKIAIQVAALLRAHVVRHDLGVVTGPDGGYLIARDPDTVYAPDVAFVGRTRIQALQPGDHFFPGSPDLAVEVMSPGDTWPEVHAKVADYLAAGTSVVIVINPKTQQALVWRRGVPMVTLGGDAVLSAEPVIPGWRLELAQLW